uniref:Uncharacterized protein n=1 Tax=Capra hircus TaxID=9925 RepID=A0A8C2RYY2_CAPHI
RVLPFGKGGERTGQDLFLGDHEKRISYWILKQRRKPTFLTRRNIVGCRIQHGWKEGNEPVEQWKGTVLEQVSVKPTLYIIKYDGNLLSFLQKQQATLFLCNCFSHLTYPSGQ